MKKAPKLLIQKWQRLVDDWPSDAIVPAAKTLTCARERCGAYTWWSGRGQRAHGYCLTCLPGASFWRCTPQHHARVVLALLAAFPGSTVAAVQDAATAPGYAGSDAGPCALCHRLTRRYGPQGRPLCAECERSSDGH